MTDRYWIVFWLCGMAVAALGAATLAQPPAGSPSTTPSVIPLPQSMQPAPGVVFSLTPQTSVFVQAGGPDLSVAARLVAQLIANGTGRMPEIRQGGGPAPAGSVSLSLGASNPALGAEGYELVIAADAIRITANQPAGVFYGAQTLRQWLPAALEHRGLRPRDALPLAGVRIVDAPRFAWRGAMLDVSRHFFGVADLKRYIDLLALYKINRLHLHLSDDQGWRIEIKSWPDLTRKGATTSVGGGPGGFYTQQEYAEIVAYARERHIVVVPEIDVPGHTNAALASYQELNCSRPPREPYTGIEVGFIALCPDDDITYRFLDDVVRELASMTPGPWIHMGGDEVRTLTPEQYARFMKRVEAIVTKHGKVMVAWGEVHKAAPDQSTIVQHWIPREPPVLVPGAKVILSPADRIYLDMKYHEAFPIGLNWAANVDVRRSYDWDPVTVIPGVAEPSILGLEAPLWTETVVTRDDLEHMAFPRLLSAAELSWSPAQGRSWAEYRTRLAGQAPRWSALGVNAYWAPEVEWRR